MASKLKKLGKALSPKRRIAQIVDETVERLRNRYDLKLNGRVWMEGGEVKFSIDPQVTDRPDS